MQRLLHLLVNIAMRRLLALAIAMAGLIVLVALAPGLRLTCAESL
jgi:Mn2+/Fe2+ NRAMP family transporter